ncbi:hypothetical protein BKH46_00095 [Helicobacter sp. 12S02634-8]|uniref:hypothetical protein n=1 Tax=Helicobacter sp. 12S02634-8 TaxID=1476199 RepID=UPI000BA7818E|nr:hypothetical protein [Helicobacter sp. 12S02634-8]PAF48361.1 hypothetical protein BKH46_00095 [Helicobacter sp. 12S02634-8]
MKNLLKHDFLENYIGIALINALIFFSLIGSGLLSKFDFDDMPYFLMLLVVLYGVMVVSGFFWIALIVLAILNSINKKLFSPQGYLTFCLPVSIDTILIAKILINLFWIFVSFLSFYIALCIREWIYPSLFQTIFVNFYRSISNAPLHLFALYLDIFISIVLLLVKFIFILSLLNIGKIKKHRLLAGIFIFLGLQILLGMLEAIPSALFPEIYANHLAPMTLYHFAQIFTDQSPTLLPYLLKISANLIQIIIFYLLARYLIANKLELESS